MKHMLLAITLVLMLSATSAAAAQKRVSLNIAGGISFPQGALRDRVYTGWHGLGTVNLSSPTQPMGVRFDLAYNRFGFEDAYATSVGGAGHQTTSSATLNFTYRLPMYDSPISPYLIAGLGAYRTDCSASTCAAATRYGWNFGLGSKLYVLGFRSFVEARYHLTKFHGVPVHYFPLTFGLSF